MTRLITIILALGTLGACAPQRARAIREEKLLSVGLPGATLRPSGKFAVGATMNYVHNAEENLDEIAQGLGVVTVRPPKTDEEKNNPDERNVVYSHYSVNPFVQIFPWDTSAFFVGVGGSLYSGKYKFEEAQLGSTLAAPVNTEIVYQTKASYVGVPFGWAWIWDNGISLTLDFGPRWRVSQTSYLKSDGAADNVDLEKRDKTLALIDDIERPITLGGFFFGYSF